MLNYTYLNNYINGIKLTKTDKNRTLRSLKVLKKAVSKKIGGKDLDKTLLLGTWNIKDLGKNGPKHGARDMEDLYYIAEMISSFDLVAIQEVNELKEWRVIMNLLGRDWDYIATDVSEYAEGGNGERMTFVWDKRKVWFQNIAGEIVLSRSNLISDNIEAGSNSNKRQFARTPFMVSFQSGWFKFDLCTVHIYFGAESGAKLKRRIKEIDTIAEEISERAEHAFKQYRTSILLGDFNIVNPNHRTMEALKKHKFLIPDAISKPSNILKNKYYDQIAIKTFDSLVRDRLKGEKAEGGVFPIFDYVMRQKDYRSYKRRMNKCDDGTICSKPEDYEKYFGVWRRSHLSDHNPMWLRIPIDFSDRFLSYQSNKTLGIV